jgi:hypothetical protein
MGRDNSVGIATHYGLGDPGLESRWGEIFRTPPDRPWGPRSHLYTYNGYKISFLGVKRPGRGVDYLQSSSAEDNESVDVYLYSPSGPTWPVLE